VSDSPTLLATGGALLAALLLPRLLERLKLSRAKHRSLAGHARMAKRIAGLLPFYEYDEAQIFRVDGAPPEVEAKRRGAFQRLAARCAERYAKGLALSREAGPLLSDLQFTAAYRVPFQFSRYVRRHLPSAPFATATRGNRLIDADGNELIDLTGSYGVNVLGNEFYKTAIDAGVAEARELGAVLGYYHPLVIANARRIARIARLDEVSFHMSGTEAVMQAVRLARYHTGKTHLVRFCGAYHGWWGDVQPGPGNPVPADRTYTLKDMDERSLGVLRSRKDIACVLVNPLQALHPNSPAPGDSSLVAAGRRAGFDRAAYTDWLHRLREVCTARGIPLIFDEVFVGFRLAPGGAQAYFGVQADMVTYGKTLGGGLPVGVLVGKAELMRRFRDDRPADLCFARGTFNSHPYVMGAMDAFLTHLELPATRALYAGLDRCWDARAGRLNEQLTAAGLPVRVAHLSTIWTVLYTTPSRYNWLFQQYLRREGLALSWVGSGRMVFSLDFTDADFDEVSQRFLRAARLMQEDGWWWVPASASNARIGRQLLREVLAARFGREAKPAAGAGLSAPFSPPSGR
jgi:glutamate-1-semialdehyde 2,1-aminomutase